MNPRNWLKQPGETIILAIDCSKRLPSEVTISSQEAKMFDSEGTDVSSTMITETTKTGNIVYVTVTLGTDGEDYNLRLRLTLSNGEIAEDDLTLNVREIGL